LISGHGRIERLLSSPPRGHSTQTIYGAFLIARRDGRVGCFWLGPIERLARSLRLNPRWMYNLSDTGKKQLTAKPAHLWARNSDLSARLQDLLNPARPDLLLWKTVRIDGVGSLQSLGDQLDHLTFRESRRLAAPWFSH
jgi:hypothetical protein